MSMAVSVPVTPEFMTCSMKYPSSAHTPRETKGMEKQQSGRPFWRSLRLITRLFPSCTTDSTSTLCWEALHAYYHREHLKEFLSRIESNNFLHTSIAGDIGNPIYLPGFRALGIFNKLITGPLWRRKEEEGHIFDLNPVWFNLKVHLQRCGENSGMMLDGECFLSETAITKDNIYEELFKDTNNVEFDALTQECLELMCCTCAWYCCAQPIG